MRFESINPEQPLASKELFYIYSITKTFTAIIVMFLAEKKTIALSDSILQYLPDIELPEKVTIKHLLNHTSGVPNYTELSDYGDANKANPSTPWSFEETIKKTCQGKLDFNPEEKWRYSNTGYMLLLLMIESVTEHSFAKNVDDLIVKRIGLKKTYVAEDIDNKITKGYSRLLSVNENIENIASIYNP